jgi:hypothetical protein
VPLAGVLATQVTDGSAHPLSLTVNGFDVIPPTGTDPGFAALGDSIEVTEAGPGGVSSMRFTVIDMGKDVGIAERAAVDYWDNELDAPLFAGLVDTVTYIPLSGGVGRAIDVTCVGPEAWLDWIIIGDAYSGAESDNLDDTIAALVSNLGGHPLRVTTGAYKGWYGTEIAAMGTAISDNGDEWQPVGYTLAPPARSILGYDVTLQGVTLRQAIDELAQSAWWSLTVRPAGTAPGLNVTVDFYHGLRVWPDESQLVPDDYIRLNVSNAPYLDPLSRPGYSDYVASALSLSREPNETGGVYIKGATAAVSGWYGSLAGPQAYIEDADLDTLAKVETRAVNYLADRAGTVRGSLTISKPDWFPDYAVHAGAILNLDEAALLGLTTGPGYRITQIRKRWRTDRSQIWEVSFGTLPASAMRQTRYLTRDVTS